MTNGKSQETLLHIIGEFQKQSLRVRHLGYALDHALDTIQALEDEIQALKVQASLSFAEVAQIDDDDTVIAHRKPQSEERWIAGLWCSTPITQSLFGRVEDAWHNDLQNPQSALNLLRSMQLRAHYNTGDRLWFQLLEAAILCNHQDTNDAFPLVGQVLQQCTHYEYKQQRGVALYLQARLYITQSNWLAAHWLLAKAQCTEGYHGTIQDWLVELDRRVEGHIGPDPVVQSSFVQQDDVPRYPTGSPIEPASFGPGPQSLRQDRAETAIEESKPRKARPTSLELVHAAFDPSEAKIFEQKYGSENGHSLLTPRSAIRSPLSPTPSQLAAEQELTQRVKEMAAQKRHAEINETLGSIPRHARPLGWDAAQAILDSIESSGSPYRQPTGPKSLEKSTAPGSNLSSRSSGKASPTHFDEAHKVRCYEDLPVPERDEDRANPTSLKQTANQPTLSKSFRKLA